MATGVVNVGGFSAAVLADLVIGLLLQAGHRSAPSDAFRLSMAVVPLLAVIGVTASWWCRRPKLSVPSAAPAAWQRPDSREEPP